MKSIWFWLALITALFAIYGTWGLVQQEYQIKNVCPKILGIPACYLVLFCFVAVLVAHVFSFNKSELVYFTFAGIVTLIAVTGTIGELTGYVRCPRTSGGIPMCFISLGICLSLLGAKFLELQQYNT